MIGPLTRDGLRVCREMCETCIFRPENVMHLRSGRVRQMVDESLANDSFIVCHDTLDGKHAVCRGFYDRHRRDSLGCRLGALVGVVEVEA
jgi:hypothetical protein